MLSLKTKLHNFLIYWVTFDFSFQLSMFCFQATCLTSFWSSHLTRERTNMEVLRRTGADFCWRWAICPIPSLISHYLIISHNPIQCNGAAVAGRSLYCGTTVELQDKSKGHIHNTGKIELCIQMKWPLRVSLNADKNVCCPQSHRAYLFRFWKPWFRRLGRPE